MARGLKAEQRHAIFTGTKKIPLGTSAAICTVISAAKHMTSLRHHAYVAGTCYMQDQQRCAAKTPVVVSVWNKKAGAGNQI
jgi:hypothetical protein